MERIDDPSNAPTIQPALATVSPGFFRRPSVLAGDQGTILTGDWANDIQEAIVDPILAAGITLAKGDETQLTGAINFLSDVVADALIATHNAITSSESVSGHLELADATQVAALASQVLALSPGRLRSAFASSLADPGYISIPTGSGTDVFSIQWGSFTLASGGGAGEVDHDITLPLAYSTSHLWAGASSHSSSLSESQNDAYAFPQSLTQIRIGSAQPSRKVYWLSLGY